MMMMVTMTMTMKSSYQRMFFGNDVGWGLLLLLRVGRMICSVSG